MAGYERSPGVRGPVFVSEGTGPIVPRPESVCRVRYAVRVPTGARFAESCTGEIIDAAGTLGLSGDVAPNASDGDSREFTQGKRLMLPCAITGGCVMAFLLRPLAYQGCFRPAIVPGHDVPEPSQMQKEV